MDVYDLTEAEITDIYERARFLVQKRYIWDRTIDALAQEIIVQTVKKKEQEKKNDKNS